MAQKLVLIRHGYIGAQYDGRFIGSTDVPLVPEGVEQVVLLGAYANSIAQAKCYCSPMLRARETADAIGYSYEIDPNLREISFGCWEGMTFDEISAADPEKVNRWAEYSEDFAFPDGESLREFGKRVEEFAKRVADHPAKSVLAVTHGGVIRALICHFLGLEPCNYLLFDVKPASISKITIHSDRGILNQLNDLCHLEERGHG